MVACGAVRLKAKRRRARPSPRVSPRSTLHHSGPLRASLQVLDAQRPADALPMKAQRRLVVASCGNAGLAAATIAAAAEWPIDVCIPDNADPAVVANLESLGNTVNIVFCPRDVDEVQVGDVGMVSTAGAAGSISSAPSSSSSQPTAPARRGQGRSPSSPPRRAMRSQAPSAVCSCTITMSPGCAPRRASS